MSQTHALATIAVLRAGALCSVQDLGRHGRRHLGISQCGAMDTLALQQANLLLGNPPGAAGLEPDVPRAEARSSGGMEDLRQRVASLEHQVAELTSRLDAMTHRAV